MGYSCVSKRQQSTDRQQADIRAAGLCVLSLGGDVDTSTPMGLILFTTLAALGRIKHEIKRECGIDSINTRREPDNNLGGRPRNITDSQIRSARRHTEGRETAERVSLDLGMT